MKLNHLHKRRDNLLTNRPAANFYEFGKFRLDAEKCVLLDGDNAVVDATPKALEILCVLVAANGRLVSKEEIIKRVWADSFVEEANLSHHIFRLRRALGESAENKFIETISKRGYRFVAPVREISDNGFQDTELNTAALLIENSQPSAAPIQKLIRSQMIPVVSLIILLLITTGAAFIWFNLSKAQGGAQAEFAPPKTQDPMTIVRVTNMGRVGTTSISPDGKFIAYSQNHYAGNGTLYVRQIDTGTEIQLLEPGERIFGATAFSPDGSYIYFIAADKRDPQSALYRIPVLGGQPTKMLSNINYFFTLSPDSRRAAFFRSDKKRKQISMIIAVLDGSGSEQTVATFDETAKSVDSVPAFSPDGKRLAFAMAESANAVDLPPPRISIYTVEIKSGEIKKLSDEKWLGIGMMNWMPDASGVVFIGSRPRAAGFQIYFLSYPAGEMHRITKELSGYGNYGMGITADGTTMTADIWETSSQLWKMDADGKGQTAVQLTSNDGDGGRGLTVLLDGGIVYTSRTGFDYDLWIMRDAEGRREGKPLTSDSFFDGEVVAAPDGKFVVFVSDRAGRRHLFRIDADGANLRQLTFGENSDSAPDISPDGKWIVYASDANNQNRIWKIPSGGGDAVQLTDDESLAPAISPDGKFIACVLPSDSNVELARLDIVNFADGAIIKSFAVLPPEYIYRAPRWTPKGDALLFPKNEKNIGNLWKQNLSGGAPTQYTDFTSQQLYSYVFSRDGKHLIVSRGEIKVNSALLKNFKPN